MVQLTVLNEVQVWAFVNSELPITEPAAECNTTGLAVNATGNVNVKGLILWLALEVYV